VAAAIDLDVIEAMAAELAALRARGGRLFRLGVGGSAANCSHAVNDFRKLCGFETYSPVDNISELTARANDDGWETVFAAWLRTSRAGVADAVFVLYRRLYRAGDGDGGTGPRWWPGASGAGAEGERGRAQRSEVGTRASSRANRGRRMRVMIAPGV
jgi:hypothetical protein